MWNSYRELRQKINKSVLLYSVQVMLSLCDGLKDLTGMISKKLNVRAPIVKIKTKENPK